VTDTSESGSALRWDKNELPNPLFAGDTLYADNEILETRESKSRPGSGTVVVNQRGIKQDGTVVLVMKRSIMVCKCTSPRRPEQIPSPKHKR
jgi:itaconyl-CoA hydratase